MKRNLALLLATILTISPVYVGVEASADTIAETSSISTETPVEDADLSSLPVEAEAAETETELKNGSLAETVSEPEATESIDEQADIAEDSELVSEENPYILAIKGQIYAPGTSAEEITQNAAAAADVTPLDSSLEIGEGESAVLSVIPKEQDNVNSDAISGEASAFAPEEVLWECSDPEIAELDENGFLIAKKEGEAVISVSFKLQDVLYNISLSLKVTAAISAPQEEDNTASGEISEENGEAASVELSEKAVDSVTSQVADADVSEAVNETITEEVAVGEAALLAGSSEESVLLADSGVAAASALTGSWKYTNNNWYYVLSDGKNVTGLREINGKYYYFASDGKMKTDWVYYSGNWYFFNPNGDMATGWKQVRGLWYYLNPSKNGAMEANTILTLDGKHYFISSSGAMMINNWYSLDGKYYYANGYGILQTGWIKLNNKWYYLDPASKGARHTGLNCIEKKYYFFDNSGVMQINKWVQSGGSYYYVNGYGIVQTGWIKLNNKWYYLDPAQNGVCLTGLHTIEKASYFFDNNGVMQINKWVQTGGSYYYVNGYGIIQTGWQLISSKWYYFETSGKLKTSSWLQDNGHWYYLGSDGVMKKNTFATIGSKTYYFDGWGYMKINSWINTGGKWYYVDGWGEMQTGTVNINGTNYEFNSDGTWIVSTASYSNRQEFIALMAQLVRKYAPQWGVKVYSPIIAQAILESAYGESSLGKKYNNFFGLKCGTLWTGKSVSLKTGEEYSPGTYTTITANFRVYDSIEEGVRGYFVFLFDGRTRYNNLIGVTDPQTYLQRIKDDGYATSSKYVQNCMNVVRQYNLTQYDD